MLHINLLFLFVTIHVQILLQSGVHAVPKPKQFPKHVAFGGNESYFSNNFHIHLPSLDHELHRYMKNYFQKYLQIYIPRRHVWELLSFGTACMPEKIPVQNVRCAFSSTLYSPIIYSDFDRLKSMG